MLSVIRYSLYGEPQPVPYPNLELETWNLELLPSVLCFYSSRPTSRLARLASFSMPYALCPRKNPSVWIFNKLC
jgi:hypothetical protein